MGFYFAEVLNIRREFMLAYEVGDLEKALRLGKRLLEIYCAHEDSDNVEYAMDMHNVALVYEKIGMLEKAVEYYKKSASMKKACMGETTSYADTLNNLAIVYHHMGKHEEGLELHKKTLQIRDVLLGRNHIDYIHSLYHLGNAYEALQQHDVALEMHTKTLKRAQAVKQFPILDLADIHGALASVYEAQGNYRKAILYYETTMDLIEKDMGCDNALYMLYTGLLASVCDSAGFTALAVEYCEKAVEIRRETLGSMHVGMLDSLNRLAMMCYKDMQFDKAMRLHKEALGIVEKILGREHMFYADMLMSVGVDFAGKKDFTNALLFANRALQMKQKVFPKNDPQISIMLATLGAMHDEKGEFDKSLAYFTEALQLREEYFGKNSLVYADTLCSLAGLFENNLLFEGAAFCLREALEIRRNLGVYHSDFYIWNLQYLASISYETQDLERAVYYCVEAERLASNLYGHQHPSYALALEKLGVAYQKNGDFERATLYLEEALDIQRKVLDEDNPLFLGTLEALADAYVSASRYHDAIQLYKEKNDVNFEETQAEQLDAATTLLTIANLYHRLMEEEKANAYFQEAEGKLKRSRLLEDKAYETQREIFLSHFDGRTVATDYNLSVLQKCELKRLRGYLEGLILARNCFGMEESFAISLFAFSLAGIAERLQEPKELLHWLQMAEKKGDALHYVEACLRLGRVYFKKREYDKAMRKFVNAKEYISEYADVSSEEYCNLLGCIADCCMQMNEVEKASRVYLAWETLYDSLELPDSKVFAERISRMAKALAECNKRTEAIERYSRAALFQKNQHGEDEKYIALLYKVATLEMQEGNFSAAEGICNRILELVDGAGAKDLRFGVYFDRVARIYAQSGSAEKALGAFAEALELREIHQKALTKEGEKMLLRLLREKGLAESDFFAKKGLKLE